MKDKDTKVVTIRVYDATEYSAPQWGNSNDAKEGGLNTVADLIHGGFTVIGVTSANTAKGIIQFFHLVERGTEAK